MSITQVMEEQSPSQDLHCENCTAVLPSRAAFCGVCGERLNKTESVLSQDALDVAEQYRITRLIRRSPSIQLFLAADNQHQRPVAIRDIDISELDDEAKTRVIDASLQEYDLLRYHRVDNVMPVIDLRYLQGHLFLVMAWPFQTTGHGDEEQSQLHLYTLQDLLQSNRELPSELTAISWIYQSCLAVERLHQQQIILAQLDPYTIVVSESRYRGAPALMVSWVLPSIRDLLPADSTGTHATYFTAPEVVSGTREARSDVYSLGAILYLLLTGKVPDIPTLDPPYSLVAPHELNPAIGDGLEEIILRALAFEPANRFQSAEEMATALQSLHSGVNLAQIDQEQEVASSSEESPLTKRIQPPLDDREDVTVSIVPLQSSLAQWYLAGVQTENLGNQDDEVAQSNVPSADTATAGEDVEEKATEQEPLPQPMPRVTKVPAVGTPEVPLLERVKQQITGVLPVLPRSKAQNTAPSPSEATQPEATAKTAVPSESKFSFFKQLQHFVLGEQQHSTTAAAVIEAPLRVQPHQEYVLRVHLTGRDEPAYARKGAPLAGLSALVRGELVHIEVRSALYQNYAYIVQQVDVHIPLRDYTAEITIPMQPLTTGSGGRRERLHIFFTDEMRHPLYEKPFAVEIFVSHLVQSGREGHNVLTIPF